MTSVTRVYRFSASHRLHSAQLSDSENAEIFGKCNNPYGHGHDYVLSVTVAGEVDRESGLLAPIGTLDRLVETHILRRVAHRNLNLDVPELSGTVPTTENVTLMIATLLEEEWRTCFPAESKATLWSVHLQETDRNGFEILMNNLPTRPSLVRKQESVAVDA